MTRRGNEGTEGSQKARVRGSPYDSTTRRGDPREAERAPAQTQPLPAVVPTQAQAAPPPDLPRPAGETIPEPPQVGAEEPQPAARPLPPKVVFGRAPRKGGPAAVVVALIIASIVVMGAAAILVGRAALSPNRTSQEVPPLGEETAAPSPNPPPTLQPPQRIGYGKFEVVVPAEWEVVKKDGGTVVLRDPASGATLAIFFGYTGSHSELRPSCEGGPFPTPGGTATPTPTPTQAKPTPRIFAKSPVFVAGTTGEMEEGRLSCPEGEDITFATTLARAPSIGISYRGHPPDLRRIIDDLIVET